jgi:hypothetical protein
MHVTINYHDDTILTVEEAVKLAHQTYGKSAKVQVQPDSFAPHDLIYFGIQQVITHRQLSILYDSKYSYQQDLQLLRAETLKKLEELLDAVIIDNEGRVA